MKLLISTLFFFTVVTNYAQDIIVVNGNDTINCKITEDSAHQIHFKVPSHKKEIAKSLPITQVKFYEFNKVTVQNSNTPLVTNNTQGNNLSDFPKTRVFAEVGYGQLLAKTAPTVPAEYKNHVDNIKTGENFNAGASRFFGKYIGLSVDASLFKTKETFKDSIFIKDDFGFISSKGIMEDDINSMFFFLSK